MTVFHAPRWSFDTLSVLLHFFYLRFAFRSNVTWKYAVPDPKVWCCIHLFLRTLVIMLCKKNPKSAEELKGASYLWLQVSFKENKATLQGPDIFMASFESCKLTTEWSQVDDNLHGLNTLVEMATSAAYLMLHGAGCMCEKQFGNISWRLRDCAQSIKALYKYVSGFSE